MKMLGKAIFFILALAALASASTTGTNYTVKAGGGGNYTTIQACATAMAAGDTCTVFGGTYNERPTISAGASGAYKTITVNGTDVVTVQGFTVNSHVRIVGNCPTLQGTVTTANCGFFITNPSSPTTSCISLGGSSTDFSVIDNVMYACGGINFGQNSPHNTNGIIQGNTISYPSSTSTSPNTGPAFTIHCDSCLFDSNDISHTSDGFTEIDGNNNVIRMNRFHDNLASECGTHSGNCHIDFVASEPNVSGGGYPTNHEVIEGNSQWNCNSSAGCHEYLQQADICASSCTGTIVRFNQGAHIYSAGLENDNKWVGMYNYNNTEVDVAINFGGSGGGGIADSCSNGATDCQYFNNIYFYLGTVGDFNAIGVSGGTLSGSGANLAYCVTSCSGLHSYTYGSGSWTGSGGILANPLLASPSLVGTALGDNHLQSGSPARNAGTHLTTVSGTISNSTSLVVADAGFFQAGSSTPGVQSDCIAVTSISNHVCITSVNYSTKTLTLSSPISAANGDPVYIYSISDGTPVLTDTTGPDLGALPYVSSTSQVSPPTGLAAVVN